MYGNILLDAFSNRLEKDDENSESVAELSRYLTLDILIFDGTLARNIR